MTAVAAVPVAPPLPRALMGAVGVEAVAARHRCYPGGQEHPPPCCSPAPDPPPRAMTDAEDARECEEAAVDLHPSAAFEMAAPGGQREAAVAEDHHRPRRCRRPALEHQLQSTARRW